MLEKSSNPGRYANLKLGEHQILEAVPDGVLLVQPNGKISFANRYAQNLFGYDSEEFLNLSVEDLIPKKLRPDHVQLRIGYQKQPRPRPMGQQKDLVALTKNRNIIPVEISLSPFTDGYGEKAIICSIRDVTLKREQKQKLQRSNEELEQFAYVASHDLQEPIRAISGFCHMLKTRYESKLDEFGNDCIGELIGASDRMRTLIDDLLVFSRVGRTSNEFEEVNLDDTIVEVKKLLEKSIQDNHAEITVEEPLPIVKGDSGRLRQLFLNLLSNGIKFKKPDHPPRVRISSKLLDGKQKIFVKDNGIGIDLAYKEKVFVIFQRLHSRDKYPGTGIGLAICKKVMVQHGGEITVESELGKGSTFILTFPAIEL